MHLVLHPGASTHQPGPASDPPAQSRRRLIRHPHRLEHPRRQQLGEHRRVEPVALHTGVRDRSCLGRVADQHPPDVALAEQPGDHHRAAARLQHHLIAAVQAGRELPDRLRGRIDPSDPRDLPVLHHGDLAEIEVHIQTEKPHETPPSFTSWIYEMEGTAGSDNYGYGLSAHPGESQGRPSSH